jgi:type II secretion system protein J
MNKREAGFTLFEMVLAVAIFSMVGLLIGSILFSVQRSWSRIRKHAAELDSFQKIDRVVDYAFRNAIPFKWTDNNLKESQIFQGEPESIILAYLHRINNPKAGGIRFIKLFVQDGRLIAQYRKTPILFWNDEPRVERVKQEVLAKNVKDISFVYADREGDEIIWFDDWDEEQKKQIPLAIQMTIEFDNGTKELWLRRTSGSSYDSALGKRDYSGK